MKTIVIANVHRQPLILPHIGYLNPIVSLTPDYPYPCIGQFRCFHGHTNALKCYQEGEPALVIEDDCLPDLQLPWQAAIDGAQIIMKQLNLDMVCLHGRGFDFSKFHKLEEPGWFNWLIPSTPDRWVLGTLIYLISPEAAARFIAADFWMHGTNIDIFLWSNRFNFCLLDPRQFVTDKTLSETLIAENPPPFIHACGAEQSVIQNPRNTEHVNR